jgi:KRAB domain-containing zinc finger protein
MKKRNHSNVTFMLKVHVASVHEGDKPFNCDICNYCFSKRDKLKRHIASIHEGKKPLKCDICDYCCSQKNSETTIPESTNS